MAFNATLLDPIMIRFSVQFRWFFFLDSHLRQ